MCNKLYDMLGLIQRYMAVCLKMGRTPWLWLWIWKGMQIEKGTLMRMMDDMFKIQTFQILGICTPLTPFFWKYGQFPARSHWRTGRSWGVRGYHWILFATWHTWAGKKSETKRAGSPKQMGCCLLLHRWQRHWEAVPTGVSRLEHVGTLCTFTLIILLFLNVSKQHGALPKTTRGYEQINIEP